MSPSARRTNLNDGRYDEGVLREISRRVLWLSAAIVDLSLIHI